VITSTFQLAPGIGPKSERQLWRAGVGHWGQYATAALRLPKRADAALHAGIAAAQAAWRDQDADRLAALLPPEEHWRLYEAFGAGAAYLDIETCDDTVGCEGISAIGFLDRTGPRLLLSGRDLHQFPELAQHWTLLVTFNGLSFDLPILRRAFPDWQPPLGHVDLRHALRRLGHTGGLKQIERQLTALHLTRPAHLDGLDGGNTGGLFRSGRDGHREALRRFAEYNLYDVVNLRTLMAHAYNALVEQCAARAPALREHTSIVPVPERGDVLYDISKILLRL
jgi:uncharacterized protein YprB with RNaseH-like and TPR domain